MYGLFLQAQPTVAEWRLLAPVTREVVAPV